MLAILRCTSNIGIFRKLNTGHYLCAIFQVSGSILLNPRWEKYFPKPSSHRQTTQNEPVTVLLKTQFSNSATQNKIQFCFSMAQNSEMRLLMENFAFEYFCIKWTKMVAILYRRLIPFEYVLLIDKNEQKLQLYIQSCLFNALLYFHFLLSFSWQPKQSCLIFQGFQEWTCANFYRFLGCDQLKHFVQFSH